MPNKKYKKFLNENSFCDILQNTFRTTIQVFSMSLIFEEEKYKGREEKKRAKSYFKLISKDFYLIRFSFIFL